MSHISPSYSSDSGSDSDSGSETVCVSPRTVIRSPRIKELELKAPEKLDERDTVFVRDQMKTRQPVTLEDLNLDVLTNILIKLVSQLGREDVLPNLLNVSLADRNMDTVIKSPSFMDFIHHNVWKQRLWITGWESGWESMLHAHRSYRNFRRGMGRCSRSDISLEFCSAIGIYGKKIICGYQCGLIIIYHIIEGRLSQPDVRPFFQLRETKVNDYSWAVVGFMTDPNPYPKEIFIATFDGCIYGLDMCTMCFSLMHFGKYSQDGGLVHFDGSDFGWVGIYVGKPNHSFRVWNRNREVIYSGGTFMMTDATSIYGRRLGRLIVVDNVVFACSRRGIITFTLTDPSITREIMNQEGGVLVASFSGNSSCFEVVSGAHLYIFSISDLAFVRKERISAYTTAVNAFFKFWVYGSGSVFMLHNETGRRRRIEPRVGRVSALKLDQKCLILANASTVNMWFYGYW